MQPAASIPPITRPAHALCPSPLVTLLQDLCDGPIASPPCQESFPQLRELFHCTRGDEKVMAMGPETRPLRFAELWRVASPASSLPCLRIRARSCLLQPTVMLPEYHCLLLANQIATPGNQLLRGFSTCCTQTASLQGRRSALPHPRKTLVQTKCVRNHRLLRCVSVVLPFCLTLSAKVSRRQDRKGPWMHRSHIEPVQRSAEHE